QVADNGTANAMQENMQFEFERDAERYDVFHRALQAFDYYRGVPPTTAIVYQVNLEHTASSVHGVETETCDDVAISYTIVGTDSHTTMINGLGVLGWGVGGIEAEAGMRVLPSYFTETEVIGVKFTRSFPQGTTATYLALKVTQVLREKNVVGKF